MAEFVEIVSLRESFNVNDVCLPHSKSIYNRLATIQLRQPGIKIIGSADSDDTAVFNQLEAGGPIQCGKAGTAYRFLTAYFAALPGSKVELQADEQLLRRPMQPLLDICRAAGAGITQTPAGLRIAGAQWPAQNLSLSAQVSSQFTSAVLMQMPYCAGNSTIQLSDKQLSQSYIAMTIDCMKKCGADIRQVEEHTFVIMAKPYQPNVIKVEKDWSSAAFFILWQYLLTGTIKTPNQLEENSTQGDSEIIDILINWEKDAEKWIDVSNCPDNVPALVCAAAALHRPIRLSGVATLHHKESHRLMALKTEMAKLGHFVMFTENEILMNPGSVPAAAIELNTYEDHRLAMAFTLLAYKSKHQYIIKNPEVVSKSFPGFWREMSKAGFTLTYKESGYGRK